MVGSKFVKFLMSIFKRQVNSSPNIVSLFNFMNDNSSVLILQTIYNFFKRSTLKWKFLRLSSAWVKIFQIPHVNFEMARQFLSNFASFFIVMTDNTSVDFELIHFQLWIKGSHQNPNFETFKPSKHLLVLKTS